MKGVLAVACVVLLCATALVAQGGRSRRRSLATSVPASSTIIISGKVVLSDGGMLTEPATVQTVCSGQKRNETHTDSRGSFSFQFGGASSEYTFDADAADQRAITGRPVAGGLQGCELKASLAGFRSDVVQLDATLSQSDHIDIGRIVLHRLQNVEGFTISATTAKAPDPARKAWERGQKQAQKGKWEEAQKSLERAVGIYPGFAAAWFELGNVQIQRKDPGAAQHSFEQSIAADSKYINPYLGLAHLALRGRNWAALTDASEKVLALNPVSFPDVWFWSGLGHYYLHDLAAAERSARRGLATDTERRVPNLEYLLGVVLVAKTDYAEAATHLRAFLSRTTNPKEIAEANKQLDEIARLSAESAPPEKK